MIYDVLFPATDPKQDKVGNQEGKSVVIHQQELLIACNSCNGPYWPKRPAQTSAFGGNVVSKFLSRLGSK